MKMNRLMAVAAGATLLVATSCMQEEPMMTENEISPDVLAKFDALGFNSQDIVRFRGKDPIAGERVGYMVGGDVFMSDADLADMAPATDIPGVEQYRTNNLVSSPRTIAVYGYTGNNVNGLDNKMQTALQWAVNNYNNINIDLSFTLGYGTNYQPQDIVVYRTSGNGGGGSAGFPSGGNPYKWVQIVAGTSNYDTNVVEHVITHEIGHCLGFRHTDYFNRSLSCPSGGNEGDGGVGAIHIPGTPTGTDFNSVMQACFSGNEDGEFGSNDVTALRYLY